MPRPATPHAPPPIPGAPVSPAWRFCGPGNAWRAKVTQNALGLEIELELFGILPKPVRLEADDWKGVNKALDAFGRQLRDAGEALLDVRLKEPT